MINKIDDSIKVIIHNKFHDTITTVLMNKTSRHYLIATSTYLRALRELCPNLPKRLSTGYVQDGYKNFCECGMEFESQGKYKITYLHQVGSDYLFKVELNPDILIWERELRDCESTFAKFDSRKY